MDDDLLAIASEFRDRVRARTFDDVLALVKGCHDYNGGHTAEPEHGIYHHGIDTVISALAAYIADPDAMQVRVLREIGSAGPPAGRVPESHPPAPGDGSKIYAALEVLQFFEMGEGDRTALRHGREAMERMSRENRDLKRELESARRTLGSCKQHLDKPGQPHGRIEHDKQIECAPALNSLEAALRKALPPDERKTDG